MLTAWIFFFFHLSSFALQPLPTLNVANITLDDYPIVLQNQTRIIGLQNALNSEFGSINRSLAVFPDACKQSDGTFNCTAACLDNTQLFGDLKTLHNCVVFPNISVHLANNTLSPDARHLAENLNIEPSGNGSLLPSNISNAIQRCLIDSCNNTSGCKFPRNFPPSTANLTGTAFINDDYFNPCSQITAHVDADVAGVGVFISYVMQMGLALLAFIATIPWLSIIRGTRNCLDRCLRALFPRSKTGKEMQKSQASAVQSQKDYLEALKSALVDFQKAQCFFMLATNIASLIGGIDSSTIQELYNTYVFIKVIAIGGYLPITFTLLNLHMIKQLSWYIITLSVVTIAVATSTVVSKNTQFMPSSADLEPIVSSTSSGGPSSCHSQNLVLWCYSPRNAGDYFGFNATSSGTGGNNILVFCFVTLLIITVDHFCRSDDKNQRKLNLWILRKLHISTTKPIFPHARTVLRIGTPTFHFVFFWVYIYCFYIFGSDLEWFNEAKIYEPGWTFGQVVAILVWAPTLCDYLWNQIRGYPKGSEHKTPKMYEVVKRVQPNQRNEAEMFLLSSSHGLRAGASPGNELPY
ncbi:hypothetical protein BDR22DRAFT_303494 [Usnea florida]